MDDVSYAAQVVVPIVLFLCLLTGAGLAMLLSGARDRQRHESLRRMIDKGIEIPPGLLLPPERPAADLRRGLVLMGGGLGLLVLLLTADGGSERSNWAAALVPLLMGAGYVAAWRIGLHHPPRARDGASAE